MRRLRARAYRMIVSAISPSKDVRTATDSANGGRSPVRHEHLETLETRILLSDVSFDAARSYGVGSYPEAICVADFNGDGISDIASADNYSDTASVLLGNGDGTFQAARAYSVGAKPLSVVAADFNNDGRYDLATADEDSESVSILLGNGDGTFQSQGQIPLGEWPRWMATADFDNDGNADLAMACNDQIAVLMGKGDGSFRAKQDYASGIGTRVLTVADFNNDGIWDLASISDMLPGSANILMGNGNGSFEYPRQYEVGTWLRSVAAGDLNGDGICDLAVASGGSGKVILLFGAGDGTFHVGQGYGDSYSLWSGSIAIADFNRDGMNDLLVAGDILLGNGDGTFQDQMVFGNADSVALGDFNNDGLTDIALLATWDNSVGILLNTSQSAGLVDPNLIGLIRARIDKPTEMITTFDLASLTSLDAHSANIADLTGLEYAVNLQTLNLRDNRLTNVTALAGLGKLTELMLSGNYLDVSDGSASMAAIQALQDAGVLVDYLPQRSIPVASDQEITTDEDTAISDTVLATDAGGLALTYNVVALPEHGTLTLRPDGAFTYTPEANYSGYDCFTFSAGDGTMASNAATVGITIVPVNDAPTGIAIDVAMVIENQPAGTVVGHLHTTDADGDENFVYALVAGTGSSDNSSFVIDGDQLLTNATFHAATKSHYSIRVRATDQAGLSIETVLSILVVRLNDRFADAIVVTTSADAGATVRGTNDGASKESGEPDHCDNLGGASVWYRWVAPATGMVTVDTAGSDFDTMLAVYTGTSVSSLNLVPDGANDDGGSGRTSLVTIFVTAGQEYRIAVDGYDRSTGSITLNVGPVDIIINEAPSDIELSSTDVVLHQPVGSVVGDLSTIDPNVYDTFTYSLVDGGGAVDNGRFTIDGNQLKTAAAFDDAARSEFSIRVRTTDSGGLSFEEIFTISLAIPNDQFTGAIDVGANLFGGVSIAGDNTAAGTEPWEPYLSENATGATVWYHWRVPASGVVTIAAKSTTFRPIVGVYMGDALWYLARVDSWSGDYDTNEVTVELTANTEYYILVDGLYGSSGSFVLDIGPLAVTNDNISNAFAIGAGIGTTTTITGANYSATREDGEPWIGGNYGGASVWYRWLAPASGIVTIDTIGSNFDTLLGVYLGTGASWPSSIAGGASDNGGPDSESGASQVSVYVSAGSVYFIAVDGYDGATGDITLNIGPVSPNSAPTGITLSSTSVAEDQPIGSFVGMFRSKDPDAGDRFTYWLVAGKGSADNKKFVISENQLRTNVLFDSASRRTCTIRVRASDLGGLHVEKTFKVHVLPPPGTFDAQNTLTLADADGDQVTLRLSGKGEGSIDADHLVVLSGTTASSALSIDVKKGPDGDGMVEITGIEVAGLLKAISAPRTILSGDITANTDGISAGKHSLTLDLGVMSGASIESSGLRISSLRLLEWQNSYLDDTWISAPSIGSITVTGLPDDPRTETDESLAGDLDTTIGFVESIGSLKVAGRLLGTIRCGENANGIGIGSIVANGGIYEATIISTGTVRECRTASLEMSVILVGVAPDFGDRVAGPFDFDDPTAKLGSLTVTGWKLPREFGYPAYVTDSYVSAANVGAVSLLNVRDTGGDPIVHVLNDVGVLKVRQTEQVDEAVLDAGTWARPGDRPSIWEVL